MAGAPFGNNNAIKNKLWSDTLRRAIAQDRGDRVRWVFHGIVTGHFTLS